MSDEDPLARALGSSRFGHIQPGERPTAGALLEAMGGVRGIIESLVPGIAFLVIYTLTRDVWLSVLVPLCISVALVLVRILTKGQPMLALAGLIGVGISAAIALLTGQAENNFVWGFFVNGIGFVVLSASLIAKRPLIGVIAGALTNTPYAWRTEPARVSVATRATWLWMGVLATRLAVQLPLYFSGETEALAATRLLLGVPLYAAALWVTWLMVRSIQAPDDQAEERS